MSTFTDPATTAGASSQNASKESDDVFDAFSGNRMALSFTGNNLPPLLPTPPPSVANARKFSFSNARAGASVPVSLLGSAGLSPAGSPGSATFNMFSSGLAPRSTQLTPATPPVTFALQPPPPQFQRGSASQTALRSQSPGVRTESSFPFPSTLLSSALPGESVKLRTSPGGKLGTSASMHARLSIPEGSDDLSPQSTSPTITPPHSANDNIFSPTALTPTPLSASLRTQHDASHRASSGMMAVTIPTVPVAAIPPVAARRLSSGKLVEPDMSVLVPTTEPVPVVTCDACPYCDDVCALTLCPPCTRKRAQLSQRKLSRQPVTYTMCQVRRHNTIDDCWIANSKHVFDATLFLASGKHPGGTRSILRKAGQDCQQDFAFHSSAGQKLWMKCMVGKRVPCPSEGKGPWWKFWKPPSNSR